MKIFGKWKISYRIERRRFLSGWKVDSLKVDQIIAGAHSVEGSINRALSIGEAHRFDPKESKKILVNLKVSI